MPEGKRGGFFSSIFNFELGIVDNLKEPMKNIKRDSDRFWDGMSKSWTKSANTFRRVDPFAKIQGRDPKTGRFGGGQRRGFKAAGKQLKEEMKGLPVINKLFRLNTKEQGANENAVAKNNKSKREASQMFAGIRKHIGKEVSALEELGISWRSLTAALAGFAVVGIFVKLLKNTSEYLQVTRELNREITVTAAQTLMVNKNLDAMVGHLAAGRAEIKAITLQAADMGLLNDTTARGTKILRNFTRETLNLAHVTGQSTDAVGDYHWTLGKLYNLGWQNLRNFGSSFKYILDQTRLSASELMQYTEGLKELVWLYPNLGEKGSGKMIRGLQGIAGALKNTGIDAGQMTSMFTKLKDEADLGFGELMSVFQELGVAPARLRDMIQKGDFAGIFSEMIRGLQGKSEKEILHMMEFWKERGLDFSRAQVMQLRTMSVEGFEGMVKGIEASARKGDLLGKAAENIRDLLFAPWRDLKVSIINFFGSAGGIGEKVLTRINRLSKGFVGRFDKFLKSVKSGDITAFADDIEGAFKTIVEFLSKNIPNAFRWTRQTMKSFNSWWESKGGQMWIDLKTYAGETWEALKKLGGVLKSVWDGFPEGSKEIVILAGALGLVSGKLGLLKGVGLIGQLAMMNTAAVTAATGIGGLKAAFMGAGGLLGVLGIGTAALGALLWSIGELNKAQKKTSDNNAIIAREIGFKGTGKEFDVVKQSIVDQAAIRNQQQKELNRMMKDTAGNASERQRKVMTVLGNKIKENSAKIVTDAFNVAYRIETPKQKAEWLNTWAGPDWRSDPRAKNMFRETSAFLEKKEPTPVTEKPQISATPSPTPMVNMPPAQVTASLDDTNMVKKQEETVAGINKMIDLLQGKGLKVTVDQRNALFKGMLTPAHAVTENG